LKLSPEQQHIVRHRGADLQVIACAGAGKTESMARRIASLLAEGVPPESVVAFTFTERAASELAHRVELRLVELIGEEGRGSLAALYVGTIHAYCQRLLLQYVPELGNCDLLDENEHVALLSREFRHLGLSRFKKGHWASVSSFSEALDVIGNELISDQALDGTQLLEAIQRYRTMLERYRVLTFSQLIARSVDLLRDAQTAGPIRSSLKYLLVDEYQDINPAQEELIRLLAAPPVRLTVVGDDDQAIYQWRGADVANIVTFPDRRTTVETVRLLTNRRSQSPIVCAANEFAKTIPERLDKAMEPVRPPDGVGMFAWEADTDVDEAEAIADHMLRLREVGFAWRDMAALFRSVRTSATPLLDALDERRIPYQCAGRSGLFLRTEISLLGQLFAWFVDGEWKEGRWGEPMVPTVEAVAAGLRGCFPRARPDLKQYLEDWRAVRLRGKATESLVGDLYRLYDELCVWRLDPDDPHDSSILGALAQFAGVIGDYEHVHRRGHADVTKAGKATFRAGPSRGRALYHSLHHYLLYWAQEAYEDFSGEPASDLDAVDVITIHQAKGLEWPVVFIPSLVAGRFPSRRAGTPRDWLLPSSAVSPAVAARYAGGDAEERRLFYVAMTRARDIVYLSRFAKKTRRFKPSPYLTEVAGQVLGKAHELPVPSPPTRKAESPPPVDVSFTELALAADCGHAWRLGTSFDFPQPHAPQLGYGRALHHILRMVAEQVRTTGSLPSSKELDELVDALLYVPYATPAAWRAMLVSARRAVQSYVTEHASDLRRVWDVERPFELHSVEGVVRGRGDIILDEGASRLELVDYKVSNSPERHASYRWQLQVYAAAGRSEGLTVAKAWLQALSSGAREQVDVSQQAVLHAQDRVQAGLRALRSGRTPPRPGSKRCRVCDWRPVCGHAFDR